MSNKRTPPILLITGKTGSGKSEYVASFLHAYVVDPLLETASNRKHEWEPPEQNAKVDMVVFDHVFNLQDATQQILSALAWCRQNEKPLWIVLQSTKDFEALKLPQVYLLELRMSRGTPSDFTCKIASIHDRYGIQFPSSFYFNHGNEIGFTAAQKVGTHSIILPEGLSAS